MSVLAALDIGLGGVFVAYLALVQPLAGVRRWSAFLGRLAAEPELRLRFYRRGVRRQWALTAVLLAVALLTGVRPDGLGLGWRVAGASSVAGALAAAAAVSLVVVGALRWQAARCPDAAVLGQVLRRVAPLLPVGGRERRWFGMVAVTAGVCEEVVYRGFLVRYLMSVGHLSLGAALVVSAVVFGLGHAYQGVLGMVGAGLLGYVLAQLYATTGSLWMPIVAHVLLDLRVLLLVPRSPRPRPDR